MSNSATTPDPETEESTNPSGSTALAPETQNGKAVREPVYDPNYSKYFELFEVRPEGVFSKGDEKSAHADPLQDLIPEKVFPKVIQQDKSLCANCYSDRWDFEAVEFQCGELGWILWERRYPIPGKNSPDLIRDERHDGRPLCCTSCGFETGQRKGELSKREASEYAWNVSRALEHRGYPHDRELLLRAVRKLGSIPGNQGKRYDVFGTAVAEAVRYEQHKRR